MGKTLAEKLWDSHVVRSAVGEPDLLRGGGAVGRHVVVRGGEGAIRAAHLAAVEAK